MSWVTRVIQAGTRSILSPEVGMTNDILQIVSGCIDRSAFFVANLDFAIVWYPQLSVFCRHRDLPSAIFTSSHRRSISIPAIL